MFFKQRAAENATLSYFFGCTGHGKAMYDSLHHKLLTLPAEVEIYLGHQAGSACGAGLSRKPASTIRVEQRFNPMLGMARIDDANLHGAVGAAACANSPLR